MKELITIAETFDKSRPIFRLTIGREGDTINANISRPIHKYIPKVEAGNVLSELVCEHYRESFNTNYLQFQVDEYDIAKNAMNHIRSCMATFLEKNLGMKNPRQSKVYRWYYRNLPHDESFNNTLVMVYKYMRSFCDSDMHATDTKHVDNTVALLEAIMEKYNDEK